MNIPERDKLLIMVGYAATMNMLVKAAQLPDTLIARLGIKVFNYVQEVNPKDLEEASHEAKSLMGVLEEKLAEVTALRNGVAK